MTSKAKAEVAKLDPTKAPASKPDPATLMAMFAEDQDKPDSTTKLLPPAAELAAVANDAWRSTEPRTRQAAQAPSDPAPPGDAADDPTPGAHGRPAAAPPAWMRIKADEQRFTSVRFSPELTEALRHLAFLTRQSKTSLMNEALIDLVAKYRKAGIALPEFKPDGTLKA
jgi:hypothetical protein